MVSSATLRVPLQSARLATGFTALKALLGLEVRNRHHQFLALQFLVDSGANVTTMAVSAAQNHHIPFPKRAVELAVHAATGTVRQRVHPGTVTVRIPGLPGREFAWPCHVVEYPGAAPRPVLGLAGILHDVRLIFVGSYGLQALRGWLVIEEITATNST
jgi:hypothetical protein